MKCLRSEFVRYRHAVALSQCRKSHYCTLVCSLLRIQRGYCVPGGFYRGYTQITVWCFRDRHLSATLTTDLPDPLHYQQCGNGCGVFLLVKHPGRTIAELCCKVVNIPALEEFGQNHAQEAYRSLVPPAALHKTILVTQGDNTQNAILYQ
jgi:hypothetical protein